jgi:DNA-binding Xre family transcriptional regulator
MAIQLRVSEIAKQQSMSMSALARRADLGMTTMRRMWHGTANGNIEGEPLENISLIVLEKLAVALGVEPCDLLKYIPERERR